MSQSHEKVVDELKKRIEVLQLQLQIDEIQRKRYEATKDLPVDFIISDKLKNDIDSKQMLNEMQQFTPLVNSAKPYALTAKVSVGGKD